MYIHWIISRIFIQACTLFFNLLKYAPSYFSAIYIKYFPNVVIAIQKFLFAVLAFILLRKSHFIKSKISVDFDWLYRRLLRYITLFIIAFIDFIYGFINSLTMSFIKSLSYVFSNSLALLLYLINVPVLRLSNIPINKNLLMNQYRLKIVNNAFPFFALGAFIFIFAITLTLLS